MSYTKGPWKYEPETKTIRSIPGDYWLATMASWDGAIDNEANAQVIAAAPDLLRNLKNMVREWEEIIGTEEENRTPADTLEKAKEAIAKAEPK